MVNDVDGVRNMSRREMLSCMEEGISVCVAMVVLMVVVGVVCLGAVGVDCAAMFSFMLEVDIFVLGEVFVVVTVKVKLVVGFIVNIVLYCSNVRGYFPL